MKRFRLFSIQIISICSLMTMVGCVPLIIGAAAGAGGLGYIKGALIENIDEPVNKINKATVAALGEFGVFVIVDELNKHSSYIRAEYKDGRNIQVNIDALTEYVSKITIRIGVFGDQDESMMILKAIEKRM